jgi:cell wall-associated NlpC family hydrolase
VSWASHYVGRTDMHCWALVREIYERQCGIQLPSYGEVDSQEMLAVSAAVGIDACQHPWTPVKPFPGAEQLFDVVVMKGWLPCNDGVVRRGVIHTGVVTSKGSVLHTDMGYAVVEVALSHSTVKRRLVGCYRHAAYCGGLLAAVTR